VIPEPKCLVCGHKLDDDDGEHVIPDRPGFESHWSCPRCGFLIAQHTIESLTADQDNAP
jgi:rubredoxin